MSSLEFAECYSARVETTVDATLAALSQIGEDNVRKLVSWYTALSVSEKALLGLVATVAGGVLVKIIEKVLLNQYAAGAAVAFLGGASWYLLIRSLVDCADKL